MNIALAFIITKRHHMLTNYFKIALRNLLKHKFYSLLNILGLSIGIASFLFILLYTQEELSYDKYHDRADDIVRIDFHARLGENEFVSANNSAPLGPTLAREYPEVESYCRFRDRGSYLIKYGDKHYKEEDIIYADSTFFKFFNIPLLQGDRNLALTEPNSIVISERMAKKYFGEEDPLGKSVILDNDQSTMVTGVMSEIPSNTHFHYDFLVSLSSMDQSREENWGSNNFNTYALLNPGVDLEEFEKKIQITFRKGFEPVLVSYVGTTWDEFMAAGNYALYDVTKLTDIHLYSDKSEELAANGDSRYIYIFGLIGLFILLIAGINFVNLTTARSMNRAKEVGVRKVVGAEKANLIKQFLSESTIISFVALIFSFGFIYLALPGFNDLSAKEFKIADFSSSFFIASALGIAALTGLLSGIYPAIYLSSFKPVKVLKGALIGNKNKSLFRNALVVFQFFITTLLIIGTVVVFQQLNYMQNKKLGYDKEQVLVLNDVYALGDQTQAFKERIKNHPSVKHTSISGFLPVASSRNTSSYFKGKNPSQENAILISNWRVDFDYVKTMGMEIVKGRDFDANLATDSMGLVINEELARQLGYDDPIGEYMSGYTGNEATDMEFYQIIGVIKNFHFSSLRDNIDPLALFIGRSRGAMSMRLETADIASFTKDLQSTWNEMAPGQPFAYQFLDERFSRMFESEQHLAKIVSVFSFLAIFIACMGLLGLATFIAQQRTKEIGIRKVLGASIPNLVFLLCKDFGALILIAFMLAAPIAWYVMKGWLADFAFAISIGISVFLIAGLLVLIMAVLSVVYQASRVAVVNPVETLKWE